MTTDTKEKKLRFTLEIGGETVYDRRNGERIRDDPSEYVHDAGVYHDGCGDHKKSAAEGVE